MLKKEWKKFILDNKNKENEELIQIYSNVVKTQQNTTENEKYLSDALIEIYEMDPILFEKSRNVFMKVGTNEKNT